MNDATRIDQFQQLLTKPGGQADEAFIGLEALVDAFIALYDECALSTQKKDKKFAHFLEWGRYFAGVQTILATISLAI